MVATTRSMGLGGGILVEPDSLRRENVAMGLNTANLVLENLGLAICRPPLEYVVKAKENGPIG